MKVIQVKCPKCGTPIASKQRDRLFLCTNCNTLHQREPGTEVLRYEVAEFNRQMHGEEIYIPFWRLDSTFLIRSQNVAGMGAILAGLSKGSNQGKISIFVPAADLDPQSFKALSTLFTRQSPRYSTRFNFGGIKNMPATITRDEAIELADFVVVTMEAEKSGVLQSLDYSLMVNDSMIVYLPFLVTQNGLQPAL